MQLPFSFLFHQPFFLLWHLIYQRLDINEPLVLSQWAQVFGTAVKLMFTCSAWEPSSGDFSIVLNCVWESGRLGWTHVVISGTVMWSGGEQGAAHPFRPPIPTGAVLWLVCLLLMGFRKLVIDADLHGSPQRQFGSGKAKLSKSPCF